MSIEQTRSPIPLPDTTFLPEKSHSLSIRQVDNLSQIRQHLKEKKLTQAGTILFDSDETLRPSISGKLPGNDHSFWQLDKLPSSTQSFLQELKTHQWQVAIVSNQPDQGHQLASLLGKIADYTPLLQFAEQNNIPFFGFSSQPISLSQFPTAIKQSFHYYFSPLKRTLYKDTPAAINEVSRWIDKVHQNGPLIWVGNNKRDQRFAQRLHRALPNKSLLMYRLPDFYAQGN